MAKKKSAAKTSFESVEDLVTQLEKNHGTGIVLPKDTDKSIEWMPTNIPSLDAALGGGLPRGRIIEIFGPESSGKTSLCQHCMGKVIKRGGNVALIDAEFAFEPTFAAIHKVTQDNVTIINPDNGEQALESLETMVISNLFDLIVVDSVAALVPKAEVEGSMGDSHMGLHARLMSQALRKLTGVIGKTKTTVIFINQLRLKIGVMFGNPETTTGGNALKFYASIRIDVRRKFFLGPKGDNDKVENPTGIHQQAKIVKNKCFPPFRVTFLDLIYKTGYDIVGDIFHSAVNFAIIEKSGAWYAYKGERLGQGEVNAQLALKSNKEWLKEIAVEVKQVIKEGL